MPRGTAPRLDVRVGAPDLGPWREGNALPGAWTQPMRPEARHALTGAAGGAALGLAVYFLAQGQVRRAPSAGVAALCALAGAAAGSMAGGLAYSGRTPAS